jgi:hypothetical protein
MNSKVKIVKTVKSGVKKGEKTVSSIRNVNNASNEPSTISTDTTHTTTDFYTRGIQVTKFHLSRESAEKDSTKTSTFEQIKKTEIIDYDK